MSTAMVSIENAPRDINGLMQLKRTILFRLAHGLSMFADESQEAAFNQASTEQMCQALLAKLQEYDAATGGVPQAAPMQQPAPNPAQMSLPAAPQAAQFQMPGVAVPAGMPVVPPQAAPPMTAPAPQTQFQMPPPQAAPAVVPPQAPPPVVAPPQMPPQAAPAAAPAAPPAGFPPPIAMPPAAPQTPPQQAQQPVRAPATTKAAPQAVVPPQAAPQAPVVAPPQAPAPQAAPAPQTAAPAAPGGGGQLLQIQQQLAASLKQLAETSQKTQEWLEEQQSGQAQLLGAILAVQLWTLEQSNIDLSQVAKGLKSDPELVTKFLGQLAQLAQDGGGKQ